MGFSNTGAVVKVNIGSDAETRLEEKYPRFVRISRRLAEQLEHTGVDKIPEVYINKDGEPIWHYNEMGNAV